MFLSSFSQPVFRGQASHQPFMTKPIPQLLEASTKILAGLRGGCFVMWILHQSEANWLRHQDVSEMTSLGIGSSTNSFASFWKRLVKRYRDTRCERPCLTTTEQWDKEPTRDKHICLDTFALAIQTSSFLRNFSFFEEGRQTDFSVRFHSKPKYLKENVKGNDFSFDQGQPTSFPMFQMTDSSNR
jgi:hypothetical protein